MLFRYSLYLCDRNNILFFSVECKKNFDDETKNYKSMKRLSLSIGIVKVRNAMIKVPLTMDL